MTRRDVDAAITTIARKQHGVFSLRQVVRCGGSSRLAHRRVASGAWIQLDAGVYALPGNPATWLRHCMAATLGESSAVVSGRSAAALHGFPGFRRGRVEIIVPTGSSHRSRLARVRQSNMVETTKVQGISVVTAAQCVIEVAHSRTDRQIGRLIDNLSNADRRFLPALQDRYVDLARTRWPGIGRVRDALAKRGEGFVPPESELEALLYEVLERVPDCPPIVKQATPPWRPLATERVDVLIPAWAAVIEADGRRWHTRVDDFERDRERDNDAAIHGYRTLRFTWHQLNERANDVVDALFQLGRFALREGADDRISDAAA